MNIFTEAFNQFTRGWREGWEISKRNYDPKQESTQEEFAKLIPLATLNIEDNSAALAGIVYFLSHGFPPGVRWL